MHQIAAVFLVCGFSAVLAAQQAQQPLKFEVASIRAAQPDGPNGVNVVGLRVQGEQMRVDAYTLRDLLIIAYLVRPFQVRAENDKRKPVHRRLLMLDGRLILTPG
jgi:hypothetical protein